MNIESLPYQAPTSAESERIRMHLQHHVRKENERDGLRESALIFRALEKLARLPAPNHTTAEADVIV